MRSPRRHHQHAGVIPGGGGCREASPRFCAVRIREHQREDWGRDLYRSRGRTPSPPLRGHRHRQLSPELGKRKRREHGSTPLPSLIEAAIVHPHSEHHLDDGAVVLGGFGGGHDYEHLSDRYLERRPARMGEFQHAGSADAGALPGGLDGGEEVRFARSLRYLEEEHAGHRETVVPRPPRFLGDGRGGKEVMVPKMQRFVEDRQGRQEITVPRPLRYLEDGQSGHGIGVPMQGFREEDPSCALLGQPTDHRPGIYTLGSSSGANISPRSEICGEEEQDLWYRHQGEDVYDRDMEKKVYLRDASYAGLPSMQRRAVNGLPSGFQEDGNAVQLFQNPFHLPANDMHNINDSGNFSIEPFRHEEHAQKIQHRKQLVNPLTREDVQNEGYVEFAGRERSSRMFPVAKDIRIQVPWESQDKYREALTLGHVVPPIVRADESESSSKTMKKAYVHDQHSSFENDHHSAHIHGTNVPEEYPLDREPVELRSRLTKGYDLSHLETEYGYEEDDDLLESYKGRSRSNLTDNQFEDIIYRGNDSPTRRIINFQGYDEPNGRALKRRYISDDEGDEVDDRNIYLMTRRGNASELDMNENNWTAGNRLPQVSYKRYGCGNPKLRIISRRASGSNNQRLHRMPLGFHQVQPHFGLKRRLRQEPVKFLDNFQFRRKHEPYSYHRYWKKSDDQPDNSSAHEEDIQEGDKHVRRDPPENSEEFKQQIHKAFLRFSKLLNEDPHQQKRYREQGKAGSLLCCVCGSLSKDFVDTHSLVMHAFNSLKVGLRTDHLGLHRALCVMMGWNGQTAPDGAKNYQSLTSSEANLLKEDLILWPPLVVIYNSSIGNSKNVADGSQIVRKEELENILKDIGVGAGKARIGLGKPPNHSTMLVKFLPTFSGLQEAERLHKYYLDKGRGRKEIKSLDLGGGGIAESSEAGMSATVEDLLYGCLAIAEDVHKLDNDTKRRCMVKSRKEIEAIADAPLTSLEATDDN